MMGPHAHDGTKAMVIHGPTPHAPQATCPPPQVRAFSTRVIHGVPWQASYAEVCPRQLPRGLLPCIVVSLQLLHGPLLIVLQGLPPTCPGGIYRITMQAPPPDSRACTPAVTPLLHQSHGR